MARRLRVRRNPGVVDLLWWVALIYIGMNLHANSNTLTWVKEIPTIDLSKVMQPQQTGTGPTMFSNVGPSLRYEDFRG
jgi:hypothetical protein